MTIHHATQKKADASQITLVQRTPHLVEAMFVLGKKAFTFANGEGKDALALALKARIMMNEYPWFEITQDSDKADPFNVYCPKADVGFSGSDLDELIAKALEEIPAAPKGIAPKRVKGEPKPKKEKVAKAPKAEGKADDDKKPMISNEYVKSIKAKGGTNGDWFSAAIDPFCKDDLDKTRAVAVANGVEPGKDWPHCNTGQRIMNYRNMTRSRASKAGFVTIPASLNGGKEAKVKAPAPEAKE
jgi:hypothetical protein